MKSNSPALPPLPKTGVLYLAVLLILALGFYVLLIASLILLGWAFYGLLLATPDLLQHAASLSGLELLVGLYAAFGVFGFAMLRGLVAKAGGVTVGIQAHRAHHEKVFTLVREIADKVNARTIDDIMITPDTRIGVREEAALWMPPGFGRRKLVIGMALLNSITMDQLRAVLAHEFGHFSHGDTFFSRFIYRVAVGYGGLVNEMARVRYYYLNPFYWVFYAYMWVYMLIASSFSRQKEFRADRFAVQAVGKDAYGVALSVVHLEGSFFEEVVFQEMFMAVSQRRPMNNIYHYGGVQRRKYEKENPGRLRKVLGNIMTQKTSAFDSHPALGERLKKQNVATALVEIPPLPRLVSTPRLDESVPPELISAIQSGPPSAAEELFGPQALKLQADLSMIANQNIQVLIALHKQARAAALDA
jgi:Zn-dependent protease with chaperone function